MICREGSARYLEYDWVAGPGNFIYETPGLAYPRERPPQRRQVFGWLQGPLEFYDDNGNFVETVDVWWFINHYESYCREHGIPINKQLYI
jgi:2,4'-dihydroxyacetophenone dioxygenase